MSDVEKIAVIGAGDMGHGIAELAALAGFRVRLRDIDQAVVNKALEKIEWSLGKLAERDEITEEQATEAFDRVTGTTDLGQAVDGVELVIEAVPEDLSLKQKVFAEVEEAAPDDAILASNTSTIRITEIGEKLEDPSRIVGMHFFNPVLLMDLVEIIPSEHSSERAIQVAEEVSDRIGKTHVTLSKDTPGFVTSRLIGIWVGGGIMAREAGFATKEAIDAALKFKAGFPMGAFELADYTGLDIGVHASDYIASHLGDAYKASEAQRQMIEEGKLGKKTGQGFYTWEDGKMTTQLSPEMAGDFDPGLVMALVANEAATLLREGVATAEEIDLVMQNGCAFPKGPLRWADERGLDNVLKDLARIREELDTDTPLAEPDPALTERVEQGKTGKAAGEGFHTYQAPAPGGAGSLASLETVRVAVDEEAMVATLTINRPHRLNAINDQLVKDLTTAFNQLEGDEHVRAILLKGKGEKAFSVGADLQDLENFTPDLASRVVRDGHKLCITMEKLAVPIVAAVDGLALGGGLELTLPCDFRLASKKAQFGLPELTLGLLPGMGGTFRLAKLIGLSHAKEFAMLADRIPAERAYEMGLVHRVYDNDTFDEEAHAFAAELAKRAPIAMRFVKQLLNEGLTASASQAMEAEAGAFGVLASTEDVIEGVSSMFMKKEPEFQGK